MGNEKRLFLLAVMTVLMSTKGYATKPLYPNQYDGTEIITQESLKDEHKNASTVISIQKEKYGIIDKNVNLELENKTGNKKVINIANGAEIDNNGNKIETINNGSLVGINNSSSNFEIVSMQGGNFRNEELISISGKKGIGINITGENANAINNKTIEVKDGATGVTIANGIFENKGIINVSEKGSIGINASKKVSTTKNTGIINVTGESSIGMQATTNATITSSGKIYVNAEKFTSGMKATGNGAIAENKGYLEIIGDGKNTSNGMIAQQGGKVINSGKTESEGGLYASGKTTNAMSASGVIKERIKDKNGKLQYVAKKYVNTFAENNGDITVSKGATAIKLEDQSTGKNTGNINVSAGSKGVVVSDSIFINNGIITAERNGIAIENIGSKEEFINKNGVAVKEKRILNNTVYLKDGSSIKGKILGAKGIDVLTLGKGNYEEINTDKYEALTTRGVGDINISNSTIALEYNKGTNSYLKTSKDKLDKADKKDDKKGNLSLSNSNLIIDIKKQDVDGKKDSLGTMIDADKVFFDNVKFGFISANGEKEFNITDILTDAADGKIDKNNLDYLGSNSTAIWNYSKDKDGDWIANKKTFAEASKSQVSEFAQFLDKGSLSSYTNELQFLSQGAFDKGMAQLSGGLHGYTADIAAVNSRTLSNTMKERALTRDYLIKRPVSSWTQDIMYIDNNHRFGGLMDVDYKETGAMGISEKQILSNGRLGLVYGGSSGKADAEDNGNIDVDTAYFGGYYNHEFNDKWSLNSNANFVYTHNRVTRNVKIGNLPEETFKSNYPTYTVGLGSSLVYTVKDDLYNKAHFYAGIDVNRIMQGTITEDEDSKFADAPAPAIRKQGAVNDKSYYSIVPSAGVMVQNTGYIFDKKYRVGADLNWETEVGNIKDGKRLHMKGIPSEYKVGTTERENIFSYSLFGALNLTEDLAVNAKYTSMFSDEYDADMVSAGFEYKMDTMGDNGIFGPIFYGLENHKPKSDRWAGTFSLMLENEDASDRTYWDYDGKLVGGDYATSNEYKPKFTLSLNDKKTNWSYYFEGYYKSNDLVKNPKGNEADSRALRLHGEARWTDTYSKGKYGINIGYRHEKSNKPQNFAYKYYTRTERGVHQLRLTPNFTYELGNGFTFTGKTTGIFEYNYKGVKEGQMDFLMESEYEVVYTGFMPRWRMSLIYFRDDRWYDNSNRKTVWDAPSNSYTYDYDVSGRYQLGQIRPTAIYYFGNGGSIKFDVRIPLGNGQWYDNKDGKKTGAEVYEVRYGFNYYHPVTPGLTMNVGGTFLNIKNKAENGDVTRSYSFRPNIGFSYSF